MKLNRYILLAILFLLAVKLYQCHRNQEISDKLETNHRQIEALTDSTLYYKNALGWEVAEKKLYMGTVSEFKAQAVVHTPNQKKFATALQNTKQKDLKAGIQVEESVMVNNLAASKKDSTTYAYQDSVISFQVTVQDTTVTLDTLRLRNDKSVLLKDTKRGTVVTITNSNPYFRTADVDALLVPEKKSLVNSKAFKTGLFIAAFAAGVYLSR